MALAKWIEHDDLNAKEAMIERELGLVHALARTYAAEAFRALTCVQDGTVGLVKAVDANPLERPTDNLPPCGAWRRS